MSRTLDLKDALNVQLKIPKQSTRERVPSANKKVRKEEKGVKIVVENQDMPVEAVQVSRMVRNVTQNQDKTKNDKKKKFTFTESEKQEIKQRFNQIVGKGNFRLDKQMLSEHLKEYYDTMLGTTLTKQFSHPTLFDFKNQNNF